MKKRFIVKKVKRTIHDRNGYITRRLEMYDIYDSNWLKVNNMPIYMKGAKDESVTYMKYPVTHGWGYDHKKCAEHIANWLNEHVDMDKGIERFKTIPNEVFNEAYKLK